MSRSNINSKYRSLDLIHDIWVRSIERSNLRRDNLIKVLDKIVENTEKDHYGYSKVFLKEDNKHYVYEISYNIGFKSNSYSLNHLTFNSDLQSGRDQKLEFLLADEKLFKMGEELRRADRANSYLQYIPERELNKALSLKLKAHFDKIKKTPEDVFIAKIAGKKYYVGLPSGSSSKYYGQYDFKILHEVEEEILEF